MGGAGCPPRCLETHGRHSADLHKGDFDRGMTRLEKLKELEKQLHDNLNIADARSLAGIAKQYRETIKEIEEIEGDSHDENEIDKILGS